VVKEMPCGFGLLLVSCSPAASIAFLSPSTSPIW